MSLQDFLCELDIKSCTVRTVNDGFCQSISFLYVCILWDEAFFTKSCHYQTYQNYEQSQQTLGIFLEIKCFKNQIFQKHVFGKKWSPGPIFLIENFLRKYLSNFKVSSSTFHKKISVLWGTEISVLRPYYRNFCTP